MILLLLSCSPIALDADPLGTSDDTAAEPESDPYAEAEAVACEFRANGAGIGTFEAMSLRVLGYAGEGYDCAATDTELTAELQYRGSDEWVWDEVTTQCYVGDATEDEAIREFEFQTASYDGEACRAWLWPVESAP